MTKRIISLILSITLVFSVLCPAVHADGSADFGSCSHDWQTPIVHGYSITIPNSDISFGVEFQQCSKCHWYKHDASLFIVSATYYSPLAPDLNGIVPTELITYWCNKYYEVFGKNATAKKYETGGGSAGTGGAGRNPSGYSGTGVPSVAANGEIQYTVYPELGRTVSTLAPYPTSFETSVSNSSNVVSIVVKGLTCDVSSNLSSWSNNYVSAFLRFSFTVPSPGYYYIADVQKYFTHVIRSSEDLTFGYCSIKKLAISGNYSTGDAIVLGPYLLKVYATKDNPSYTAYFHPIVINCIPTTTNITNYNKITINNNTWNGNIYQDNSTNLTYIYPQYTTINENNETVTNISNNPIIYNNETKQYYTYDTVTNNYYYITYETPTPSPSPSPDPTPTPEPGGDTGDTNSLLDVLVQIRDNMIQGFADIKATLVQGWADLSANFTLAIENLNLNITNIFNKKFPDQSTPETAKPSPSPSPSPSPEPSPSPTPDPGETPTPTPAPTDKPSNGNTNNFWNFVFPGGNDDGTENGHKGILWALISLLIAVVTFVLGLGCAYAYVFPFLPAGLVTTIHICVLVLLLFAIIKFVRSFL